MKITHEFIMTAHNATFSNIDRMSNAELEEYKAELIKQGSSPESVKNNLKQFCIDSAVLLLEKLHEKIGYVLKHFYNETATPQQVSYFKSVLNDNGIDPDKATREQIKVKLDLITADIQRLNK